MHPINPYTEKLTAINNYLATRNFYVLVETFRDLINPTKNNQFGFLPPAFISEGPELSEEIARTSTDIVQYLGSQLISPSFNYEGVFSQLSDLLSKPFEIGNYSKNALQLIRLVDETLAIPRLLDLSRAIDRELEATNKDQDSLSVIYRNKDDEYDLMMLGKIAKDWNFIINAFSRLIGDNDTKIKIGSVTKGSLIVDLIISSATILTIVAKGSKILANEYSRWLSITEKKMELKKLMGDVDALHLENIDKAMKMQLNDMPSKVADILIDRYFPNGQSTETDEPKTYLTKALHKMMEFMTDGGRVSPKFLNPTPEQKIDVTDLSEIGTQISTTKARIFSITDGKEIKQLEEHFKNPHDQQQD